MEENQLIPQQLPIIEPQPVRQFPLWAAALIAIFIVTGLVLTWRSLQVRESVALPTLTPSPLPSPTPIRKFSRLASESAFLSLEAEVSSVSAALRAFVTDDPSLSPPIIDLPLGF